MFLTGCEEDRECVNCVDVTPPAVPTNVFSVTGDGFIDVYWSFLEYPDERDLFAYLVWRRVVARDPSDPGQTAPADQDMPFQFLAEVAVEDPFDAFLYLYIDQDVVNSANYEYAVSSIDAAGNESELSLEVVLDTPRPEGFAMELIASPIEFSGFDFSGLENGRVDPTPPTTADIRVVFEDVSGLDVPFVEVARQGNVRFQDYGNIALPWVDWAPATGYAESDKAELILDHSYIVEIRESPTIVNYAKFEVVGIRTNSVVIDWAYQPVIGLPELLVPAEPKACAGETDLVRF